MLVLLLAEGYPDEEGVAECDKNDEVEADDVDDDVVVDAGTLPRL